MLLIFRFRLVLLVAGDVKLWFNGKMTESLVVWLFVTIWTVFITDVLFFSCKLLFTDSSLVLIYECIIVFNCVCVCSSRGSCVLLWCFAASFLRSLSRSDGVVCVSEDKQQFTRTSESPTISIYDIWPTLDPVAETLDITHDWYEALIGNLRF